MTRQVPPLPALLIATASEMKQRGARRQRLSRGQVIWRTGDRANDFIWIEAGLVKIVLRGAQGGEAIVGLFGPGDSIGDTAVMDRGLYPADALVASRGASIGRLQAAPLLAAAETDPRLADALRQALLLHTHALQEKIQVMSAGSVPRRLATLLGILVRRFGRPLSTESAEIPISLSRAELAALVGATTETTIRVLSLWTREGTLATSPGGFRVRTRRLQEIAASG